MELFGTVKALVELFFESDVCHYSLGNRGPTDRLRKLLLGIEIDSVELIYK